ncbi:MAG: sulfite exporter TauE/SafE family protein, partial [Asgard group archaeon]
LAMIFATSIGATITYLRNEKVVVKLGLYLAPVVLIGATFGFYFHLRAGETTLLLLFSFVLFITSIKIFTSPITAYNGAENGFFSFSREKILKKYLFLAFFLSFLAGFFSASLGIGGGVLFVPVLHLVLAVPMINSVGTSSFMIVFTAAYSLLLYGSFGHVDLVLALPLAIVAFFGAFSGSRFALSYVKVEIIRKLFALVLIIVAIRMLLRSVF